MKVFTALNFVSIAAVASAFTPAGRSPISRPTATVLAAGPLDNLFALLKGGKVGLVKSLAGEYDAVAAREVLDEKGVKYTVVELDKEADGKAIRAEMGDLLGRTSVPAIWIKETFIGGMNDGPLGGINTLNSSNKLDDMLKSAGAM